MGSKHRQLYEFGDFHLDTEERLLLRDGEVVPLTPKAFDVLLALVEQPGHLLEKETLLKTVWPDSFVEENNLADNISKLRKALGENGQKFIETIPKRGYRFVAEVRETKQEAPVSDKDLSDGNLNDTNLPTMPTPELTARAKSAETATVPATGHIWKVGLLFASLAILGAGAWLMLSGVARKNTPTMLPVTAAVKAESSSIKSIAILPFKQLTPRKDDEYLGLGIADTLINRLSTQRQIQIRPLNAALADKDSDALAAGRAQKADAVLEGTVQHVGHQLRINARLLRISDGISLWTEEYDFTWQDYFATQDAIAKQIVNALALQLSTEEQATIAKPLTKNAEALQLYLKGRYLYNNFDPSQYNSVLTLFQQAIAKDPEFAWAYEGVAASYLKIGGSSPNPKEAWAQARTAAQKAIEIDPQLAAAYAILSFTEPDNPKAEQLCLRALELDPNNVEARSMYSLTLMAQGKFQAAQVEIQKARALNPLSLDALMIESTVYFYAGQFEQEIESARRILATEPTNPLLHFFIGEALTQLGKYDEAIAEYKLAGAGENDEQIAAALALSGRREEALQILNNLKAIAKKHNVSSYSMAHVCIALGDKEQALTYLTIADEKQALEIRYIKVDPRFASLHSDPRFQEILRHRNLHD